MKLEGEDGTTPTIRARSRTRAWPRSCSILVAGVADERRCSRSSSSPASPGWRRRSSASRFVEVQPDSPAAAAGLQPGEAIVAIDGQRYQFIAGPNALVDDLRAQAGETVVLTIADAGRRADAT